MEKNIKIEYLSEFEVEMLDTIWSLQDKDSVEAWMSDLPEDEARLALSLINLLTIEFLDIDHPYKTQSSLKKVNQYLKKFRK